ncbi:hypothetical protein E2C01_070228 [Portunus trituberculatus]|uniref:Uncharacterized protein n=1 Tax=Portunus trituberculatus TaxID=210409 RepID=A0A5B7HS50_PORTR|nr:hypothetical protein [Portunus trituberculatus]
MTYACERESRCMLHFTKERATRRYRELRCARSMDRSISPSQQRMRVKPHCTFRIRRSTRDGCDIIGGLYFKSILITRSQI